MKETLKQRNPPILRRGWYPQWFVRSSQRLDLFQFSPKTNLETRKDEKLEEKLLKDPLQIDLASIYTQGKKKETWIKESRPKAGSRPAKGRQPTSKPAIKAGGLEWPFAGLNGRRRLMKAGLSKAGSLYFSSPSFDVFLACKREESLQID